MGSDNIGANIRNAVKVLQQTYENINRLFNTMDTVGSEEGYLSITPRFLSWKSDVEPSGWFIKDFIKLYQRDEDPELDNDSGLKDGPIYAVEINLEEQEPRIYLIKYTFDMDPAVWRRLPTVSDYRFYYDSTINDVLMELSEDGDINIAVPKDDKGSKTYNGIKEIRYTGFDLVSLNSRDKVKTMIFDELKKL